MPRKQYNKKSYVTKNQVQKMIYDRSETKQIDWTYTAVSINDVGRSPLNTAWTYVAQGDTQNTRDGNAITVTGIYSQFALEAGDTSNVVRVILYIPHDTDDDLSISPTQLPDMDKFTILYDKLFVMGNSPSVKTFQIRKKFAKGSRKGIRVSYAGGSSYPTKNAIKFFAVSDSSVSPDPIINGTARVYFKDM